MRWETLSDLINGHDLRVGSEVGVLDGKNLLQVFRRCPDIEHVYAVDSYIRPSVVELAQDEPVTLMQLASTEAAREIADESLDWVFIDADHSFEGVSADIEAWRPKVRPGGFLTGHDYASPKWPDVMNAVHRHFRQVTVEQREKGRCGVWMVQL